MSEQAPTHTEGGAQVPLPDTGAGAGAASENGRLAAQQLAREEQQQQQGSRDTAMPDAPADSAASPAPIIPRTSTPVNAAPSPLAAPGSGRSGTTPLRNANGGEPATGPGSRAASAHPEGPGGFTMPAEAAPHGAPVRQYLNGKVTGAVLEGMKIIAKEQPKDPLRVLGQFLLARSKEVEGTS